MKNDYDQLHKLNGTTIMIRGYEQVPQNFFCFFIHLKNHENEITTIECKAIINQYSVLQRFDNIRTVFKDILN